jgi:hypothetical protein
MESGTLCELVSYGGLHRSRCRRFLPSDLKQLRTLFREAKTHGRSVTLRGAGLAFDAQSLGHDWVISLDRFGGVRVDVAAAQVTVGPGARWGEIVRATLPHGLLLPIVVTTSYASAGGTLASNGLGRFSQVHGKEADWVERFTLLTPEGELLECRRDAHPELFRSVLGGHGYLGAVVEATYRLLRIGNTRKVRHRVYKRRTFEAMAEELLTRPGVEADETVTSLVIPDGGECSLVFHARFVEAEGPRLPGLDPAGLGRSAIEWAMRSSTFSRRVWQLAFNWLIHEDIDYVDPVFDYLFFMDGNVRAKALGLRLKLPMQAIQQSFVVPIPSYGATASRIQGAVGFLRSVNEHLVRHQVASVFFDVLVIPQEKDSVLSSTRDFDGFMVSVAFEESASRVVARIQSCLEDLSRVCLGLGGRVHLSKNVYTNPDVLEAMYGPALDEFFLQKSRVDADAILCNGFLEKLSSKRVAALRRRRGHAEGIG